ncbi:GFA domain-containing protein [Mycena sanguinolenta]|uniref:GFA domain-containing protein n=1 Tax=Mycena sanguinolenta TaxID=230812 RepID=A0A8H6XQH8_9AGAR|nr:GFA domain-containing protein [Mycena sanguinolenta]
MAPADTKSLPIPWPEGAEIKVYTGGCHCKKIRYEFEHPDIYATQVMNCNCSICEDRGYLNVYTPEDKFRFTNGSDDDMAHYEFGARNVGHRFCKVCGTSIGPAFQKWGMVVVNTRTIDGVDLDRLKLHKADRRSA